ncbi:tRNA (adenosine(37)-N6)-threonylcarbamoyltransferase complex dimerization subunit type 1 TsaB [Brevibacillus humidisoli]|uniref:tRNA (adenosine(37)-N6)-threonylcarbamoyltransferase complex dimerization subunit type 1 TsaB n=1 Tax=Brevibacillus humidisoli TaxID=2895522 RepID=UPI001E369874|nr:tRNA (adenosine(37)-N6)-threonylcarbamoyltransferase complex dimerization subunit type 1 TsaB [Brevibacillus humidisoli]UFJ40958.1 tRNA (adenosine(37)-N6)-threonylcarbamoyltransferase complex dimerization subunit type 1 TsaB [Brevibacillus humidisoli]
MRILAIDTSNLVLSVAVVDETRMLGEWTTNKQKDHSVRLMDGIAQLLETLELEPEQLDGIAVAHGPGSYTGVRIGVAAAKSMAWSLGIPVVGVSSLEVVAANALGFAGAVVPLFDARRGQVYTACYRSKHTDAWDTVLPERIILLDEWLSLLAESLDQESILFLGDDTALHQETIRSRLIGRACFAPPAFNHARAAHLGWIGLQRLVRDADPHLLNPEYLQMAEAEAKWLAKQGQ